LSARSVEAALGFWGERLFDLNVHRREPATKGGRSGSLKSTVADGVRTKLRALFGGAPEVMVRLTGGGRGMAPIKAHMAYISRHGTLPLEDERGEKIQGPEALFDLVQEWRCARSYIPWRSHRREALNIMLSMPLGTDGNAVFAAARDFAQGALRGHKFALVMHEPHSDARSNQPHVHLVVRMQGQDGGRLHPQKADLGRWRQEFADHLAERGIAASATRRYTRGEIQPRLWPQDPGPDAREGSANVITPSGRAAATQAEVLAAWRGVVGALSRSEDLQDQALARQALAFVLQMPMIARRRAPARQQERAPVPPVLARSDAIRKERQGTGSASRAPPERTR
jgi:hypothetical protein